MLIQETFLNATEQHLIGENEPYEPYTDNVGELYRSCQKEYGRCVSSAYIDQENGPPKRVGWVFQGRDKYEDTQETYLREVWVTLYDDYECSTVVEAKYHELSKGA